MPCIMAIGQQQTTSLVGLPDKFFAHRRSKLQGRVGPRRQPTSAPAGKQRAKAIASGLLSRRFASLLLWWHPSQVSPHLMRTS